MSHTVDAQKLSLAWLDGSPADSEGNSVSQQKLRVLDSNLKILKSKTECEEYIKSQPTDAGITLIVNGRLGQETVPDIQQLPQIIAIYVFCMDKTAHEKWALLIPKVKGVFIDFDVLEKELRPKHTSIHRSIVSEIPPFETAQIETIHNESIYAVDIPYMTSDNCFDYLIRMEPLPTDKDDYISLCQNALQGQHEALAILQIFKENYIADRAISWLFKHQFFYTFIEGIFQNTYVNMMFPCRLFIRDIQKQLEKNKYTSITELYRSEPMPNEKFQQLKRYNGKTIAMKSFFLTNLNRETALSCTANVSSSNESKRILFIIEADPQIQNVKLFADIGSLTDNEDDPHYVMFMIGSLFKITEIEDEKDGIINIKMTLCGNDDETGLKELFDQFTQPYIDSNIETSVIGFGQLLFHIGHSIRDEFIADTGVKVLQSYLNELPNDHPDRPRCYDALGNIGVVNQDSNASLEWYKKSFELRKETLPASDPNLAESCKNLALAYLSKKDSIHALDCFHQLLIIWKQLYGDEHGCLVACYIKIASIYESEEKLLEAMSCYYQALAIMLKHNSFEDVSYAVLYHNLGNAHTQLNHFDLALGYYKTSLEMKLRGRTSGSSSVALTYRAIGLVYEYMSNIQQSRENLEKALEIYRQLDSSENSCVTEIEEYIRKLPS